MTRDYYADLGVIRTSTDDEIKKAYRKLAMKYHPDRNPGDKAAEASMKVVNEAYGILGDPVKKAKYDSERRSGSFSDASRRSGRSNQGWGDPRGNPDDDFNFDDIMKDFERKQYGGYGFKDKHQNAHKSSYDDFLNELKRKREREEPNEDVTVELTVSLKDAFTGKSLEITFRTPEGTRRTVTVNVPAGIESGKKLRCTHGGSQKNPYQEPGDLFVLINVEDGFIYRREAETLFYKAIVSPFDLMLGATLEVPTIDGSLLAVQIRAGTQPSSKIRIPNRGMSIINSKDRGHMYIELVVEIPENLKDEHIILLRDIQKDLEYLKEQKKQEFEEKMREYKKYKDDNWS
jgi:DnaJ-class molecular chaperone